jgi:hypothetical protein
MTRWILLGTTVLLLITGIWLSTDVRAEDCDRKPELNDEMCFQFFVCPPCELWYPNWNPPAPGYCDGSYVYGLSQYYFENKANGDQQIDISTKINCSEDAVCPAAGSISPGDCTGPDGTCVSVPGAPTDCRNCSTGPTKYFEVTAYVFKDCEEEE